jgi:peptide/nickel transport system permease protein
MMGFTTSDALRMRTSAGLDRVGLMRRFLRARRWHGAEWYITVLGAAILLCVAGLTVLAPLVAPHDPNDFIGAQFTPPGGGRQALLARRGQIPAGSVVELSGMVIGVQRNRNGANLARQLGAEGVRFEDQQALLDGLKSGAVDLIFLDEPIARQVVFGDPQLELVAEGLGTRFLLGTDNLGRDITSRLVWGARTVLGVALSSAVLASAFGIPLGLISGFVAGRLDKLLSLTMDSIYSFPGLLLAIAMATMLGPGVLNVAVAISVIYVPTFFRIVRGQVLSIKEQLYVEAARSLGARASDILLRYIFPNVVPSVVVVFSLNIADAILTEAGLSFIGLGLPPDVPDWGYDLSKGHQFLVAGRWWMITFPGVLITLVAAGFSLLGEGLSEMLNPRLSET